MPRYLTARALFLGAAFCAMPLPARAAVRVDRLRCEYRQDPLGIDVAHPRLQWVLNGSERGERQTAYRILVASSREELDHGRGDLWDSGKVNSGETIQIPYAGRPLHTAEQCWWKVKSWDRDGHESGWSPAARWTMGLLDRSDWRAEWIGCDIPRDRVENATYLPSPLLRKSFRLEHRPERALLFVTAAGLYDFYVDGKRVGKDCLTPGWTEYGKRVYYQTYDVTSLLGSSGKHSLAAMLGDGWYGLHHGGRGRLALLAQLRLDYGHGNVERVVSDGSWKTSYQGPIRTDDIYNGETYDALREIPDWNRPNFDDSTWAPARVGFGDVASGFVDVTAKLRAAIHEDALTFAVTNTALGDPAYGFVKQLSVDYRQGGKNVHVDVPENGTLRVPANGPLTLVKALWGAPAAGADVAAARRQAHPGDPVRKTGEIHPVKITEPKPGHYIFDLGQNFAGWARLKVRGKAGEKVTLRFVEMLNPDGTIYTTNLRGAKCTDTYVCRGSGTEVWEPRFTFHGFRYVELTGVPEKPALDAITGVVLNSDLPMTGEWSCNRPLLNRLYQNIVWGQRSNYLEVPTDCPQRDERMGWTGDAQVFIGTGSYNMDVAPFFTAWLNTFNDAQDPAGGYPNVAPKGGGVSPAWGDAGVICPWTLYRMYGDTQIIRDHWDGMVRWMDYLQQRSNGLIRPAEGFGDWLNLRAEMPKDVISTAYFAHDAELMSQMADATGNAADKAKYRRLFEAIRAAFNRAFVASNGRIKGDTQTTYLMALGFDLLPASQRPAAEKRLVELIAERQNHISTGFLGVNLVLPVLTQTGHPDLAWTLQTNSDYPSWLYSVTQGATTIWERWDGWTQDRGFQDPGMNSFNHYSYGSCGQWMFSTAAGIDTDGPAFSHLRVRPLPGGGVDHVKARYDSIRGRIATEWTQKPDGFRLDVTIPANTTATVYLPAKDRATVLEGGQPAAQAEGVRFLRQEGDRALFEIGSGTYHFHVPVTTPRTRQASAH